MDRAALIAAALGAPVRSLLPLGGGSVGEVLLATLNDGRRVVAKVDDGAEPLLHVEARMLEALAGKLPVPAVLHASPGLLVMEHVEHDGRLDPRAEEHAADLLAALHSLTAPSYGFAFDTLLGGLVQPNAWTASWPAFFAERRLLSMAERAHEAGRLPAGLRKRLESLAIRLETLLPSPHPPGLIHGDVWSGNVLVQGGRVAAFVDPALSFADPELELAFVTLFHTFGERFFARYREHRPIAPGFFEERRDLYNLYPLLVHVRLFGGGYVADVERTLRRFGA